MILKLAGIVILVLLGLILAVLLTVLLVPVRYALSGAYKDKAKAEAKVTWLFHGVSVKITYEDTLDIVVKVLGRRLFSSTESLKEAEDELEEMAAEFGEELDEELDSWEDESGAWRQQGEEKPKARSDRKAGEADSAKECADWKAGEADSAEECADWEDGEADSEEEYAERKTREPGLVEERAEPRAGEPGSEGERAEQKAVEPGSRKARAHRKAKGPDRGKDSASSRIKSLKAKWDQILTYKEKGIAFLENEENQKTMKLILRQCRALIRHILPTRLRGRAVLGFEDPAVTGKVLAGLGVFYAWYGDALEIIPVFDEKILEVEGSLKGRVRAGTLLALAIRVLFNKNFRRLVRCWRRNGGI